MDVHGNNSISSSISAMEVSMTERVVEACILSIIAFLAFTGNVSLWCIICREKGLRSASNALILCLSSADILVSVLNMPVAVATIIYGYWPLSSTACQVLGFTTMLTFVASVMSLGIISINRYFLICRPYQFKQIYTAKKTGLMIFGTWLFSAMLATPPLIGWGVYDYLPGQSFCFCQWKTSISYTFFMVGVCFGGPCSVMTVCYIKILKCVRDSSRKVKSTPCLTSGTKTKTEPKVFNIEVKPTNETPTRNTNTLQVPGSSAQNALLRKKKKKQQEDLGLTKTFLVVIFVFIISWLPFCVTMFLSVFSATPVPRIPDMMTLLLGCANSSCNPIIYGLMNTKFRAGFKRLYCWWLARHEVNIEAGDISISVSIA